MSCERVVKTFKQVEEVRIECCDRAELESIEKTLLNALVQKIEKLNILIKNCDIYSCGGTILVNDRYNICSEITSVAEALGLTISPIQCSLRGKNYIVSDKLVSYLAQFGIACKLGKQIANQELTETIKDIITKNSPKIEIDASILAMVENIMTNGQYITTRTREITEVYEDYYIYNRTEGEWESDANEVRDRLMSISKQANEMVKKTNEQLREGTAKLIYARARQMGYAVQEVKKENQTQLVLVRCE